KRKSNSSQNKNTTATPTPIQSTTRLGARADSVPAVGPVIDPYSSRVHRYPLLTASQPPADWGRALDLLVGIGRSDQAFVVEDEPVLRIMDDPAIVSVSAEAPHRPETSGESEPVAGHCSLASFLSQAGESLTESGALSTAPAGMTMTAELEATEAKEAAADTSLVVNLITYSADTLKSYRQTGPSTRWPDYLETEFKNERGVWDPNRWHKGWQIGPTPPLSLRPQGGRGMSENEDGRSVSSLSGDLKFRRDPKDRLRIGELDGLKLSPQRRSFFSGCQVAQPSTKDSQDEGNSSEISLRPDPSSNRRLGSGRFSGRQEAVERLVDGHRRLDDRHGGYYDPDDAPPRPRRVIVLDRDRSRERLSDRNDRGDRNYRWNNYERYGDNGPPGSKHHQPRSFNQAPINLRNLKNERPERRGGSRFPRREESEPEWMSAQVEQGELMELRGFDDSPEKERPPRSENAPLKMPNKPRSSHSTSANNNNNDELPTQTHPANGTQEPPSQAAPPKPADTDIGFNLDDILQCDFIGTDQISQILSENPASAPLRGASKQPETARDSNSKGSRFSQFFKRPEQPEPAPRGADIKPPPPREEPSQSNVASDLQDDSRRSSIQDELAMNGRGRLHRFGEPNFHPPGPNIRIPSPTDAQSACYFAPISPAAKTVNREDRAADLPVEEKPSNNLLMDLLKGNGKGTKENPGDDQTRHSDLSKSRDSSARGEAGEDMSAFKKFIMSNSMEGTSDNPHMMPPFPHGQFPGMRGPPLMAHVPNVIRPSSVPNNAPTEQEILAGLSSAGNGGVVGPRPPIMRFPNVPPRLPLTPDLLHLIHSHPSNPTLLETREAKSLQFALAHGHAKPMQLVSEFAHREFDPHQREVLVAVLKLLQSQGRLPVSMHQLHQQQQQQGHPLPAGGNPHVMTRPQPTSPRSSPHFPDNVNLALLQQQQPPHGQQRLSPAMMMQLAAAQQAGRKPASLSVSPQPAGQQRIPSPQEISLHTQNIMQHALIKRKLEEQREKYRQRQEGDPPQSVHAGQHMHQAAARIVASEGMRHRSNSDAKQNSSPLTFTPTVVMKKFVSDRRDSDPRPQIPELKISQSGEISENKNKHEAQPGLMTMPGQSRPPPQPHLTLNNFMSALQSGAVNRESRSSHHGARSGVTGPPGADLSRFFSHDVLSRAGPPMPPVPIQEAMTLEEIERQASSMRT
ncbi:hypothetical protein TCAL_07343, partial [Tigriopus californicus]